MQISVEKYLKGDKVIWAIIIILSLFSVVMAYSASSNMAYRLSDGDATPYLFKHTFIMVLGIVCIIYFQHFKFKYLSRLSQMGIWVAAVLLLVTLLFGRSVNSANRWIMGFQPSDLAKIVLVIYVARMLTVKAGQITNFKEGVLPILIPIGAICFLILPADFSTAALLLVVCFVLMYVGGVLLKHLGAILLGMIVLFMMLIMVNKATGIFPRAATWEKRMVSFFGGSPREETANDKVDNYQAHMSELMLVEGGLFPQGPGKGTIKNEQYSSQSDFVYSSVIEDFGSILGGLGLLLLYVIFLYRSIKIMNKTDSKFGGYLSFGLSFMLVFQALINMGVGVGLLPVTGQALPLISMGGTSILFTCISIGIILNISRTVYQDEEFANE